MDENIPPITLPAQQTNHCVPSVPPENDLQTHRSNTQLLWPILVVLTLVCLGCVVVFAQRKLHTQSALPDSTPTTILLPPPRATQAAVAASNTDTWQTYRNEEYGFEFKYPADWKIREEKYPAAITVVLDSNIESTYNDFPLPTPAYVKFSIIFQSVPPTQEIKKAIDSSKIVIIAGRESYQTSDYPDGMLSSLLTFIPTDVQKTRFINVGLWPYFPEEPSPVQNQVKQIYDEILTTFGLIEV